MLAANIPPFFNVPFGNSAGAGFIRTIPVASQIGITPGAASLTDGFPPLTFSPVSAGGVPPFGQDMNGILNEVTANLQWYQAGGTPVYNSAFSAAIGGYPNGAILQSANGFGLWRSTVDNNLTNPDTGGAGWVNAIAGRLLNIQVFTSSGTYNSTAGTNSIIARAVGGGGGSGGTTATSSVQNSLSQNGASGAYAEARFTSGFTGGLAVTIGAAGAAGAAAGNGGTGGTTSLGSLISCPGGTQGSAGGLTGSPVVTFAASPTAAPTISGAAQIISSLQGAGGSPGFTVNVTSSQIVGGNGGSNPLGSGGVTGSPGLGKGAGAGGVTAGISSSALVGQAGTAGTVIVYEFA
jgi:hypothetical protein